MTCLRVRICLLATVFGLTLGFAGPLATPCNLPELGWNTESVTLTGQEPFAVWTGSEYGVVLTDNSGSHERVYLFRLDESGEIVGAGVPITAVSSNAGKPAVVWTGSGYGVAWQDERDGNREIYFARLDASGSKLGADVRVTTAAGHSVSPNLAWTGSGYFVTWADNRSGNWEIYFSGLDALGAEVVSDTRLSDADGARRPSLAWTGSELGVAWSDNANTNSQLYFARIDASGGPIGAPVQLTTVAGFRGSPVLVWTGSEFGLTWVDNRDGNSEVYFARLTTTGARIGGDVRVTDTELRSGQARLAWTGTEYGLAWVELLDPFNEEELEIRFARLDVTGVRLGSDLVVTEASAPWGRPVPVWSGSEFGLLWSNWLQFDVLFRRIGCNCVDGDSDGVSSCNDCDDGSALVYPGAPQLCDGTNTDCDHADWPAVPPDEADDDADGFRVCEEDCDDSAANTYPGAPQLCDGVNDDCDDPNWPLVPVNELDLDTDGFLICGGDCDDDAVATFPGAAQLCDGINNDCDDAGWPLIPPSELDVDADGFAACEGDCDDGDGTIHPAAEESCNGRDDDCDDMIDEDENGEDSDSDAVPNACDNCVDTSNPGQEDVDLDTVGSACDNCQLEANPSQADLDGDGQGDRCDPDDGFLAIYFEDHEWLAWVLDEGIDVCNVYRGDLEVLATTGIYTQQPASNPLAAQHCELDTAFLHDVMTPTSGEIAFYLLAGRQGTTEGGLGLDGDGNERPNTNPCP